MNLSIHSMNSTSIFFSTLKIVFRCFAHFFLALFLLDIAEALDLASALEDAPHACSDSNSLVGDPSGLRSGPGLPPARAR